MTYKAIHWSTNKPMQQVSINTATVLQPLKLQKINFKYWLVDIANTKAQQ